MLSPRTLSAYQNVVANPGGHGKLCLTTGLDARCRHAMLEEKT